MKAIRQKIYVNLYRQQDDFDIILPLFTIRYMFMAIRFRRVQAVVVTRLNISKGYVPPYSQPPACLQAPLINSLTYTVTHAYFGILT